LSIATTFRTPSGEEVAKINTDVKERIILVIRVRIGGREASKIAERELHKLRSRVYK